MLLVLGAGTRLHVHAGEVKRAVRILDRHLVQVDRLLAGDQATDLALTGEVDDAATAIECRLSAVSRGSGARALLGARQRRGCASARRWMV